MDNTAYPPFDANDFAGNMTKISDELHGGQKPEDLSLGFIATGTHPDFQDELLFVGSRPKQYSSAMIFGWLFNVVSNTITEDHHSLIRTIYAEKMNDEPGTHPVIEFILTSILNSGTVTIQPIEKTIDSLFEQIKGITPKNINSTHRNAINWIIEMLDSGKLRVAEKINGEWITHQWLKKAVLLFMKINGSKVIHGTYTKYFDKIPSKYLGYDKEAFKATGVRVVPPATARKGSYIAPGVILMPSYTNIGAYIGSGTMVDTWATVGSCAQIGKNCHLSGGVGIGGVLEPIQDNPTIIEDNCFIGARSEVVEGVIVGEGAVISMGVYIGKSTKIYNRMTGEITYGYIPPGSVVVSGNLPSKDGTYSLYCAVIVKQVDAQTRAKTSINELLRDI